MPFLFSLLVVAGMIFALIDIITRDQSAVKHMPKFVWLFLVILLPLIGTVLWFTLGREYADRPRPSWGARAGAPAAVRRRDPQPAPAPVQRDTRSTEQQLADLEREIEEDRLRAEIARRRATRAPESGETAPNG